jgi:glutathione synthase/RimK-type ligase-like ATP-grasp enzyme
VSVRVALAACAGLPDYETDTERLVPALAERGIDAETVLWTDPGVDWSAYDAVLAWKVWDYFHRAGAFDDWVVRVDGLTRLWNPAPVLRWNAHKRYLAELGARGVPVLETVELRRGTPVDLAAELADRGWHDAILKPAVAGASLGLVRVRGQAEARAAQTTLDRDIATADLMLQPFLPTIAQGELSLLYLGGAPSHAVLKRPRSGEIRVQPQFGGSVEPVAEPPADAVELAERVLAEVDADLLYARVDLVRDGDGALRLIELEVIEPFLFLESSAAAAGRLADAVVRRLADSAH